ncbi:hypothetical protein SAMN05444678_11463 [Sphingomonas sp. YR710]|nr:hypothetical protein SAMN05444678_11463 [Sphingomonas sp. YR710]
MTMLMLLALGAAGIAAPAPASPRLPLGDIRNLADSDDVTSSAPVTGSSSSSSEVVLRWSSPVSVKLETRDNEIVARFDHPLPPDQIRAMQHAVGDRIGRFEWNENSFLLQAAAGDTASAEVCDNGVRLIFAKLIEQPASPAVDPAAKDFALASAAANQAAGYPNRARAQLLGLVRQYPRDPGVERALADSDAAIGARLRAGRAYLMLRAQDDDAGRIVRELGGAIGVTVLARDGTGFRQIDGTVRGTLPIYAEVAAEAAIRVVRTHADPVIDSTGIGHEVRESHTMLELAARGFVGPTTRVDLVGATWIGRGSAGLSGQLRLGPPERELRLLGAYHLPDISTAEQAVGGGFINRISIGGTLRLSSKAVIQADGYINRYGLAGEGVVARTVSVTGGLDYLLRRREPWLTLTYRLEAEYPGRLTLRPGGALALPFSNRENHTVQLATGKRFGIVQLGGSAGWTKDRFGGSGPTATINASTAYHGWRAELATGVSSISRPDFPGRQYFLRVSFTRALGRL